MQNEKKERNAHIRKLRYEEGLICREIGEIFGLSRTRISQIAPMNRELKKQRHSRNIILLQECIQLGLNVREVADKIGFSDTKIKKLMPKYVLQARTRKFWNQIKKGGPNECWPWSGSKGANGYGRFGFKSLMKKDQRGTHCIAWVLHNHQLIKNNMQILHTCDNQLCCNPKHLYMGTPLDNMKDRDKRGRGNKSRKFSDQEIIDMRERHSDGESIASIRRDSCPNISYTVVLNAILGRTYKDVGN